jgi:hypothetical protein
MLTEKEALEFEQLDSEAEANLGRLFAEQNKLRAEKSTLHNEFRKKHRLHESDTRSAQQIIADWRWQQKHPST